MKSCICKRCGKIFLANRKLVLCDDCRIGYCVICGKEFKRSAQTFDQETCSYQCAGMWRKQTGVTQQASEKAKQTWIAKYGVDNPTKSKEIQEKTKKTNLEKYGKEYISQVEEFKDKSKETLIEKYGVDNASKYGEFKEKRRQTNLEKYGAENTFQVDEFKEKSKQTCLETYGFEYANQSDFVKDKIRKTNLEKFGFENPAQNSEVKEKMRETTKLRYGVENPFQNEDVKEKIRQTNLERYGVEYPTQNIDVKNKIRETNLERLGVEYPAQNSEVMKKMVDSKYQNYIETIEDPIVKENYILFHEDPKSYLEKFEKKPTYSNLCEKLGMEQTTIHTHIVSSNCEDLIQKHYSNFENEVVDFLKSIDSDLVINRNNRQLIKPQEIDIYLPEYKLGIECNSTYVHNSSLPSYNDDRPKPENYHQKKSLICEEKGIFLFHLFEWEWNQKREIIQSMLKNLIGKCDNKYYARKLQVIELDQQICSGFLNENHRQGSINSSVRLGLIIKDTSELISVMTFGKMRSGIGRRKDDDENTWELSRFCSKLDTAVVGGASKLFKFFVDHFEPERVVSFSDIAHTKGTLYEKLGYKKVSITDPGYCYLHYQTDLMLSREQCQKQNLRKLFQDDTIDLDNKTESQIMLEHGFVRMYDSGSIRWEWTKEEKKDV